MRNSYIFVFEPAFGSLDDVRTYIDTIPEILNWRTELPNSFFLVSELSAKELFNKIKPFSHTGKFLISETTSNKQGWLGKTSWNLMNKKRTPDEEDDL